MLPDQATPNTAGLARAYAQDQAPAPQADVIPAPERIVFVQHGWSDTGHSIGGLVESVVPPRSLVIAPSLNYVTTWLRIEPLIAAKTAIAAAALAAHPHLPVRIVAHSMGGLIWSEILHRHPHWWPRIESFVMVGSPIGGSDLARMIDPLGLGIGIARDLGRNRRDLAEAIAAAIPTLVIASDLGDGSDGLVTVESTKVPGSQFTLLRGIAHSSLRLRPEVGQVIQDFWQQDGIRAQAALDPVAERVIRALRSVPGMTDGRSGDFAKAKLRCQLGDGVTLHTWKNPAQLQHIFVADRQGNCLFAGYVGWGHGKGVAQALAALEAEV